MITIMKQWIEMWHTQKRMGRTIMKMVQVTRLLLVPN